MFSRKEQSTIWTNAVDKASKITEVAWALDLVKADLNKISVYGGRKPRSSSLKRDWAHQQTTAGRWCGIYIYNGILLSHKKEWNNAICSKTDEPSNYHTKWSKSDKDKYHMISLICRLQKMIQMNLFTKQKQTHRCRKQTYGYQRGKGGKEGQISSMGLTDTNYYT